MMTQEKKRWKGVAGVIAGCVIALGLFAFYFFKISDEAHINIQKAKLWTGLFDADKRNISEDASLAKYHLLLETPAGEELNLDAWSGNVLFINYWASWCAPCIAEMPTIKNLYEEFSDEEEIKFLLLSLDEDPQMAVRFMEERDFNMPFYFLNSELPEALQYSFIPTTYVISKQGKIIYKNEGMADYNSEKFKKWLREQISEKHEANVLQSGK